MKNNHFIILGVLLFFNTTIIYSQTKFLRHNIAQKDLAGFFSAYATDIDGDGDVDVLGAADYKEAVTWWENDGSENFTEHIISDSLETGAYSVYAIDMDGDSDVDVLTAANSIDDITWWENDGSENFTDHIINGSFDGARSVFATDIDTDGDVDVLGAAFYADDITWWENDGSENFTEHIINGSFDGAQSVYSTDMDGDGDMDVLGTALYADDIAWWENDGSENFTEHTINSSYDGACSVYATDVDSDGDMDVLGTAENANAITWWENDGSENFTEHLIDGSFDEPHPIFAADLDGDDDVDVLSGTIGLMEGLTWWENDGNENFTEHLIDGSFGDAASIFTTDIDGDGDMDVLAAGRMNNYISWFENVGEIGPITFINGSDYFPSLVPGQTDQSFGRFQLLGPSADTSLIAATILLTGNRTGATNFKLWESADNSFNPLTDRQLGSSVPTDPGNGNTIAFSSFSSVITFEGVYYFVSCDLAISATGVIQGFIQSNSSLTLSEGEILTIITNDPLSGTDIPLPVKLTSFRATPGDGIVTLNWITESEIDNAYFIIERSMDNENFILFAQIEGQGSSTERTIYTFKDKDVFNGVTYYYRLADRDFNGVVTYHNTVNATPNEKGVIIEETGLNVEKFALHSNFPNPFNSETAICFDIPTIGSDLKNIKIFIYNTLGQLIINLYEGQISGGRYEMKWHGQNSMGMDQPSGIYFLIFDSEQYKQSQKMILIR